MLRSAAYSPTDVGGMQNHRATAPGRTRHAPCRIAKKARLSLAKGLYPVNNKKTGRFMADHGVYSTRTNSASAS